MTRKKTTELSWIVFLNKQWQRILPFWRKERVTMLQPITLLFLLLMISLQVVGQDLDQDCRPIPLPSQCRPIALEIARLERRIEVLELRQRDRIRRGEFEQDLADQINELKAQRRAKASELARCQRENSSHIPRRQVAASTLDTIFTGRVTAATTEGLAPGPFTEDVRVRLQFSQNRCEVKITEFPPIVFDTDTTPNFTITVTRIGGGTGKFFPVSKHMTLPLTLKADVSILADSTASATLTTGNAVSTNGTFNLMGAPLMITNSGTLESCGTTVNGTTIECSLTLVGTTVFQGGLLNGDEGSITINGNITSPPPQPPPPPNPSRQECLQQCEQDFIFCNEQRVNPQSPPPTSCQTRRAQCVRRCRNQ